MQTKKIHKSNWFMAIKDKDTDRFKGFVTLPVSISQIVPTPTDKKRMTFKVKKYGIPMGRMFKC